MDAVVNNNEEIDSYIVMKLGLLGSGIAKLVDRGYNPILIGAGPDRYEDYQKQMDYIRMSDIKDKVSKDMKLFKTERTTSGTKAREYLTQGDFSKFKKIVPKEVANLYNDLVTFVKD